jgi:orotidine-5'-phosphate decarboxylase
VVLHFADRLVAACRAKGNSLCVGLDPRWAMLPQEVRRRHAGQGLEGLAAACEEFCLRVLELVAPLVPAVKVQMACFEAGGPAGLAAMQHVLRAARQQGLITILDGKKNDIASTAQSYAEAVFGGTLLEGARWPVWEADALTVNPYLGADALEPFITQARSCGGGVFLLVRTSNPGSRQFQDLCCGGRPLYLHVAEAAAGWARQHLGRCGLGDVGAVVGVTQAAELAVVRQQFPELWLLLPGYGAQGGGAAAAAAGFRPDGLGALVNSSRGIIAGFAPEETQWEECIRAATRQTLAELLQQTPMRRLAAAS